MAGAGVPREQRQDMEAEGTRRAGVCTGQGRG